jgi:lysozyme
MKCNKAGKDLIKKWEGLRLKAYLCPAGVPTIGYGHTGDVKMGNKITEHQADVIFDLDLEKFEEGVTKLLKVPVNENQFAALVSFAYNVGLGALGKSTLLRLVNSGKGLPELEFAKWTRGGGKVLPGLVKRRQEEALLFLKTV